MAYFPKDDTVSLLTGEEKEMTFRLDRVYDHSTT